MSINYYISHDKDNLCIVYSQLGILPKRVAIDPQDGNGYLTYVPERTCKPIMREYTNWLGRSIMGEFCKCGALLEDFVNFCPNCGARVEH